MSVVTNIGIRDPSQSCVLIARNVLMNTTVFRWAVLVHHQHYLCTSSAERTQPGQLTQSGHRGYSIAHNISSNTKVKKKEEEVGHSILTVFSFQTNCYTFWGPASWQVDKYSLLLRNRDIFFFSCIHVAIVLV